MTGSCGRIACYGTHEGEFSDVQPTSRRVSFQIIEISRAGADGRFAEHWSSADLPGMLRQLSAPAESSRTAAD
jgi:predicted ester cyclase